MTPFDLEAACDGYLVDMTGRHLRYVYELEQVARDIRQAGVDVYWSQRLGHLAGCCNVERRRIYLAPWLFWAWPWFVRAVTSHELGHVVMGPSQELARVWQTRTYGAGIQPPPWMVA